MTDIVLAATVAMNAVKLVRLLELTLDTIEETGLALDDIVEMRAAAKREGRDNLSPEEIAGLLGDLKSEIDSIR